MKLNKSIIIGLAVVLFVCSVSIAKAETCWCLRPSNGGCSTVLGLISQNECNQKCTSSGWTAIYFDNTDHASEAQCRTAAPPNCWCLNPTTKKCEKNQYVSGLTTFECTSSKNTCDGFCSGKGANWRAIHCDNTDTDYNQTDTECGALPAGTAGTAATQNKLPATSAELYNPLGEVNNVYALVSRVIKSFIGILGAVALVMFVIGGIIWMTSGGVEKRVTLGRTMIINATIGIILAFLSYTLVSVFISALGGLGGGTTQTQTKTTTK